VLQKAGGRHEALVLPFAKRIGTPKTRGEQGGYVLPI
jgi:hypothetical protein